MLNVINVKLDLTIEIELYKIMLYNIELKFQNLNFQLSLDANYHKC
jgi:hypothetical protein